MSKSQKELLFAKYEFGEQLGTGAFSEVKVGIEKATGNKFAIKIIDKAKCKGKEGMIETEVNILKKVRHENIVQLYEMYEIENKIYLVMEIVTGGELFDEIVSRGKYTEVDTAKIVHRILLATDYLHSLGIAHRDLKPENLLLSDKTKNAKIMISDFGLSKIFNDDEVMKTACGTPGYVAPEVLKRQGYGREVDMWSLGVITYILLCGYPPFYDQNNVQLFKQIMAGSYEFDKPWWDKISETAKDFIRHLLVLNVQNRYTTKNALMHPFIENNCGVTDFVEEANNNLAMLKSPSSSIKPLPSPVSCSPPIPNSGVMTMLGEQLQNQHIQSDGSDESPHPVNLAPTIAANLNKNGQVKQSQTLTVPDKDAPGRPLGSKQPHDDSACIASSESIAKVKQNTDARSTEGLNAPPSKLKSGPCSIRMLTYNIFLRAPGIKNNLSDHKDARLSVFGEHFLGNYDIVAFQDLIAYGSNRQYKMLHMAKKAGFEFAVCSPSKGLLKATVDGGLMLLSRYPIVKSQRMSFKKGLFSDRFSAKGAIYAKITVSTTSIIHVFTSHLQCRQENTTPEQDPSTQVRLQQCIMLKEFIDECCKNKGPNEPIFVLGDFNINSRKSKGSGFFTSDEYITMMRVLRGEFSDLSQSMLPPNPPILMKCNDVTFEAIKQHPVTYGDVGNFDTMAPVDTVLTSEFGWKACACTDYILWLNFATGEDFNKGKKSEPTVEMNQTKVHKFLVEGYPFGQLSDHYGISTVVNTP